MMNATGPLWQLMTKERYNWIKGVLVQIRNGESVKNIRRDHSQCYKWCSAYALANDGEGGFLLVLWPKNTSLGSRPTARCWYGHNFERAYANIKCHHGVDHCKGNTLLGCIGERIHNIGRNCSKLFTQCRRLPILCTVQEYFWHAWQGQTQYVWGGQTIKARFPKRRGKDSPRHRLNAGLLVLMQDWAFLRRGPVLDKRFFHGMSMEHPS